MQVVMGTLILQITNYTLFIDFVIDIRDDLTTQADPLRSWTPNGPNSTCACGHFTTMKVLCLQWNEEQTRMMWKS